MSNFINEIKQYQTDSIILNLSRVSIEIFTKGARISGTIEFPIHAYNGELWLPTTILLTAWDLLSIEYLSIYYSNDYKSKCIQSINEIANISNLFHGYENSIVNVPRGATEKYIFGITNEQFIYQAPYWIIQRFNRNYHILVESKNIERCTNINQITKERTGLSTEELTMIYIAVYALCLQNPLPYTAHYPNKHRTINRENINRVIKYYTTTYEEVKNSNIGKQIFYSKPFIKTSKNQTLMTSIFPVIMLIADGLYWMIRDYYRENNSQEFVNAFGEMFECYVDEVLQIYLKKEMYKKIPKGKTKRADFIIEFENIIMVIELKSSLIRITARQQVPDIEAIDKYFERNIQEAYNQLCSSADNIKSNKPVLKLIMFYDNFLNTLFIEASIPEIFSKDGLCQIITIAEFETLLILYNKNIDVFNNIVMEILNMQNINILGRKSLLNLFNDHNAFKYQHFSGQLDYFHKFFKSLIEQIQ